jgi:hypothetical protein
MSSGINKKHGYRKVAIGGSTANPWAVSGVLLAVAMVVLAAHWPALSTKAIVFDDAQYLVNNGLVRNPGWDSARRFLAEILEPSTVRGYYQPLSMISLMLDYAMGGRPESPMVFHLTSLLLHTANAALAGVIFYLLFGRLTVAGLLSLLWGLHPLTVEPIPWIGERKTLLAAFFSLAALVFYILYAQRDRRHRIIYFTASLLCYVLALLSKPTSVPLPLLMLILDIWFLARPIKKAVLEKIPFFAMAALSCIITIISQGRTARIEFSHQRGLWEIILIICHNIVFYPGKLLWPAKLYPHYAFPDNICLANPAIVVGLAGTVILAILLLASLRFTKAAAMGFLFFVIAALPTMQVLRFSYVIASDKFMYLPSLGLFLAAGCGLLYLHGWFTANRWKWRKVTLVGFFVIAGLAETGLTHTQYTHWQTSERLYRHILRYEPQAPGIWNDLGVFYYQQHKTSEALDCWQKAFQLGPASAETLNNLAWLMATEKTREIYNPAKAVEYATSVCQLTAYKDANFLDTLATAYAANGQLDKAIETAQKAHQEALRTSQLELTHKIEQKLQSFRRH